MLTLFVSSRLLKVACIRVVLHLKAGDLENLTVHLIC